MRRWNGWGDERDFVPLPPQGRNFLEQHVGPSSPPQDATLEQALAQIPPARLPTGSGFQLDEQVRLRHARGQSFPDWVAMRAGRLGPFPDAVAFPGSHEEVAAALETARRLGAAVIPYGGGTSVVGHLTVPATDRPVVSISLERMQGLLEVAPSTWLARFQAGVPGPQLEAQLSSEGFVLGHFPQSWEYSTIGGWVATRSSGQQSLRYGRIEQLFHGGRLATPRGELRVGGLPASAAGPDLREAVLGSEGRLGILTEVQVRIRPRPEAERFHAVFFPSWDAGLAAIRSLAQSELPLSLLRLSNEVETETQLALAGHPQLIAWLQRYLRLRGVGPGQVLLLLGASGDGRAVGRAIAAALDLCGQFNGVHAGQKPGAGWVRNRFRSAYLRNTLWEAGYAVDTVETCLHWPQATPYMRAVEQAARDVFEAQEERVHAYTHLSHVYDQGCSIYSTFLWRAGGDLERDLERWSRFKKAVSETIVKFGGTISHQHGVGADHAAYLPAEKGPIGVQLLRGMMSTLDPDGLMNPGKLLP